MSRMGEYYIEEMNRLQEQEHQLELEQMEQWYEEMTQWWSKMNLDTKYIQEQENDDNGNR